MIEVNVIDRNGDQHTIQTDYAQTVMEAIRDEGLDDLIGQCGGCCSCATCHVYVDPTWAAKTGSANEEEGFIISSSAHSTDHSRLSCQINLSPEISGIIVTLAPED